MERALYIFVKSVVGFLQALPLLWVVRLGRAGGALFYFVDARHRNAAFQNLKAAFPEKSETDTRAIAKENFKRIGENFASAVKTANMEMEEIEKIFSVHDNDKFLNNPISGKPNSVVFAIGHFGNFELYARSMFEVPGYKFATTYRGLRQESLNRLLQSLREKSGCLFFERRKDADALKAAMNAGGILIGFLSDQHAGDRGLRLPFFGRDCSTSSAPAVMALRYNCPLFTSICYRVAPGKWRIEVGDEIPTHDNGQPRSLSDIMLEVNRTFEVAIRRDPANWFWVHNRWKPGKWRSREPDAAGEEEKESALEK